jgi:hypothetical protein
MILNLVSDTVIAVNPIVAVFIVTSSRLKIVCSWNAQVIYVTIHVNTTSSKN